MTLQLPYAVTVNKYFNGADCLIVLKRDTSTKTGILNFSKCGHGLRNFKIIGIQNIDVIRLTLDHHYDIWKFNNVDKVNSISIPIFQGLTILPTKKLFFMEYNIHFETKGVPSKEMVRVCYDIIFCGGNEKLIDDEVLTQRVYLDTGKNLLVSNGTAGTGALMFAHDFEKKQNWINETILDMSENVLRELIKKPELFKQWLKWSGFREIVKKTLETGEVVRSNIVVYKSELIHALVTKRDNNIRPILNSSVITSLYSQVSEEKSWSIKGPRPYLKFTCTKMDGRLLGAKIQKIWLDANVTFGKVIHKEATTAARMSDIEKMRKKYDTFYAQMENPVPPIEYIATDSKHALWNMWMFNTFPNEWKNMDTVENIQNSERGQQMRKIVSDKLRNKEKRATAALHAFQNQDGVHGIHWDKFE